MSYRPQRGISWHCSTFAGWLGLAGRITVNLMCIRNLSRDCCTLNLMPMGAEPWPLQEEAAHPPLALPHLVGAKALPLPSVVHWPLPSTASVCAYGGAPTNSSF